MKLLKSFRGVVGLELLIDLGKVATKSDLHELLKESLHFPEHYGCNLDALFDLLTEPHEMWDLTFKNTASAKASLGDYFDRFRETVLDAEDEIACIKSTWLD